MKSSPSSTRLSATAVKGIHAFAPLAEPVGNSRGTEDSGEKSSMEVAITNIRCVNELDR